MIPEFLLALNLHWVADAGAAIVVASAAVHTDKVAQALTDLFDPNVARKVQAISTLTALVGAAMAYLGRPRTVPKGS